MRKVNFLKNIFNKYFLSKHYCFEILQKNTQKLYLTSSAKKIYHNENTYLPNSGLRLKDAKFTDAAKDHVSISGFFDEEGVKNSSDILDAEIKIFIYSLSDNNQVSYVPLLSMRCSFCEYDNSKFVLNLKPASSKLEQPLLKLYSKKCRAVFGDEKCGVNKYLLAKEAIISDIKDNNIYIEKFGSSEGFFTFGELQFITDQSVRYHTKIIRDIETLERRMIELEKLDANYLKIGNSVLLIPGCDKHFISCCKKFSNAINFRGEPMIPTESFLLN
jgi:uncharacterized phage protein (TIGR02218 family)